MALLNVGTLTSKTFIINDCISEKKLDFLFLVETWLTSDGAAVLIEACPPNYNFFHSVRQGKQGGGIAIILSNKYTCTWVSFGDFSSFEYVALTVKMEPTVLLLTLYRPPRLWTGFLNQFSELMSLISTSYGRIIVNGDFNIHVNKTDPKAMHFLHILDSLELTQHVTVSTHNLGNTLDIVISRGIDVTNLIVNDINVSDHYCVFFDVFQKP